MLLQWDEQPPGPGDDVSRGDHQMFPFARCTMVFEEKRASLSPCPLRLTLFSFLTFIRTVCVCVCVCVWVALYTSIHVEEKKT